MLSAYVFYAVLAVTIGYFIYSFLIGRKADRSRAGIAQTSVRQIALLGLAALASITTDWRTFAISFISRFFGVNAALEERLWYVDALVFLVFLVSILVIAFLTHVRLRDYHGAYFLSDDYADIVGGDTGISDVPALLAAAKRVAVNKQVDAVLPNRGRTGKAIFTPTIAPTWRDICLRLYCSGHSDLTREDAQWSDRYHAWIVPVIDFLNTTRSEYHVLYPVDDISDIPQFSDRVAKPFIENEKLVSKVIFCAKSGEVTRRPKNVFGISLEARSKAMLLTEALDLTGYAKHIVWEFDRRERIRINYEDKHYALALKDTFVEPRVAPLVEDRSNSDTEELGAVIDDWLCSDDLGQLALLGEFGQGKSTAVLSIAAEWARSYLVSGSISEGDRVPLLIELRGRSPRDANSTEDLLGEWGGRFGLSGAVLMQLVESGFAILIFEGFDEVRNAARELDRYAHFNRLWEFAFRGSKIIFTGRPNFFLGQAETSTIMQTSKDRQANHLPYGKVYNLQFLEKAEIGSVLRNAPRYISDKISEMVEADPSFLNIAQRPSMLPAIASQWERVFESDRADEEITAALIIESYIDSSFLRKESPDSGEDPYQAVHWKIRKFLTQAVALYMLEVDGRNTISGRQVEKCIEGIIPFLDEIFEGAEASSDVSDSWRSFKEEQEQREADSESVRDRVRILAQDVRANGVLAPDPAGGVNKFYFPHKQFYEFFLGKWFVDIAKGHSSPAVDAVSRVDWTPDFGAALWREPMILYHMAMIASEHELRSGGDVYKFLKRDGIWGALSTTLTNFYVRSALLLKSKVMLSEDASGRKMIVDQDGRPLPILIRSRAGIYQHRFFMLLTIVVMGAFALTIIPFPGEEQTVDSTAIELVAKFLDEGAATDPSAGSLSSLLLISLVIISAFAMPLTMLMLELLRFPTRSIVHNDWDIFVCAKYRLAEEGLREEFGAGLDRVLLEQGYMFSPHNLDH